jgi:hypothetical protein
MLSPRRALLAEAVSSTLLSANEAITAVTFPAVLELFAFLVALVAAGQFTNWLRMTSLVRRFSFCVRVLRALRCARARVRVCAARCACACVGGVVLHTARAAPRRGSLCGHAPRRRHSSRTHARTLVCAAKRSACAALRCSALRAARARV